MRPQEGEPAQPSSTNTPQMHLRLVNPTTGKAMEHPLLANEESPGRNAPPWLRPFFSLRVQLLFAYILVLILSVILACMFTYNQASSLSIALIALGVVVVGSLIAFFFTTLLLRPLWRVTDAAQAIAVGDLQQRERLPLRLPPQDEIDRLAGSINEMVTRLEYAEETQRASEQRFQRFFSDASHQLRTPLTSIRGFTEVLMRGAKDDPETALRVLKRMKSESERMTYLINDLFTLSRLDEQNALKKQYVNLVELAAESIEQAKERTNDGRTITLALT
ncbi:MAG: HAMP domain-containing protein, partial [Ktedonobacteraceae bacterium]|nr:HAMP domain-containing protein [Ktedonobacteraceae bacterium]